MSDGLTDALRWMKPDGFTVSIIAAIGKNRELDWETMKWDLPRDIKRFKDLTLGNTVIMGRKTHDLIGDLPDRTNFVISRKTKGKNYFNSVDNAISSAETEQVFLIGGEKIYQFGLDYDYVDRIYLTMIDKSFDNATVFFPKIGKEWKIEWESEKYFENNLSFKFINYLRKDKYKEKIIK